MTKPTWFRPRGYLHFDVPVAEAYALGIDAPTVTAHKWSPLIHYVKSDKRYKPSLNKTVPKKRPIMYASHRDSCILAKYSSELVDRLDKWYSANGLNETVVAYRPLGKSNYHFAERVQNFVRSQPSLTVMCFDVTGFFDNLNHAHLKERIKWLLEVDELPADWYAVFRAVARYRFVNLEHLKAYPPFAQRLKARGPHPLATIKEVKTPLVLTSFIVASG